jgi:hypothetical protein
MKLTRVFLVVLVLFPMSLYADNSGGYQTPFDSGGGNSATGCSACVMKAGVLSCESGGGPGVTYANCQVTTTCDRMPGTVTTCTVTCSGNQCFYI